MSRLSILSLILLVACGKSGDTDSSNGDDTTDVEDTEDLPVDTDADTETDTVTDTETNTVTDTEVTEPPANQPPIFLDLASNTLLLSNDELLTITAVLTDPDGIDDLIGGTLKSVEGASYGAFQTASSEGSYEITLSWSDLNTVENIDLLFDDQRTFSAFFFDAAGNEVSRELSVTLTCAMDPATTCEGDGICTDLTEIEHCSDCDKDCTDGPQVDPRMSVHAPSCDGTDCTTGVDVLDGGVSCRQVCAPWTCVGAEVLGVGTPSCDDAPAGDLILRCSCSK